jgi:hypothetical protein
VLVARYGEEAGRLAVEGWSVSLWWREVAKIRDGESTDSGGWFEKSIVRRIGNGADTFFWTDPWLRGGPLSARYRSLFDLSNNKLSSVAVMSKLG